MRENSSMKTWVRFVMLACTLMLIFTLFKQLMGFQVKSQPDLAVTHFYDEGKNCGSFHINRTFWAPGQHTHTLFSHTTTYIHKKYRSDSVGTGMLLDIGIQQTTGQLVLWRH